MIITNNISEKIDNFFKEKNLTSYKVAQITGISEPSIGRYRSGKSKPNSSKLEILLNSFPELQSYLSGSKNSNEKLYPEQDINQLSINEPSEIFKTKAGTVYTENSDGSFILTVPLVPFEAYASYVEAFHDEVAVLNEWEKVSFHVDKVFKGKYLGFRTKGDSMNGGGIYDTPDKALMLGRELQKHHWKDGFNKCDYGFVIISKYGMMHKDITHLNLENGTITCHSRNPSPEYRDFELELNEVYQIFKIHKRTF